MEIITALSIFKSVGWNFLVREEGLFASVRLIIKYVLENLQVLSDSPHIFKCNWKTEKVAF